MANSFTKAAFIVTMSGEDAELIRMADLAMDLLDTTSEPDELREAYANLGPRFATVFPPTDNAPFASFFEIFDDSAFPHIGGTIEIGDADEQGRRDVVFSGEQFEIETVAQLLFMACKSALPCAFEWSHSCDRLRVGEFGGGCVIITEDGPEYHSTTRIIDRAITREIAGPDEAIDGFVLATRHAEHGLSFWSNAHGFGRLALATVFSEAEAASFDKPIADDEPEWLAMPMPLRA